MIRRLHVPRTPCGRPVPIQSACDSSDFGRLTMRFPTPT